jgi:hypothetical protein
MFVVALRTKAAAPLVTPWPQRAPRSAHTQRMVPELNTAAPLGTV